METIARGIPVIIAGNPAGLTHNPIPENIKDDIWRLCDSSPELAEAIEFYVNCSEEKYLEFQKIGEKIKEEYFAPVTHKGTSQFLGLGSSCCVSQMIVFKCTG